MSDPDCYRRLQDETLSDEHFTSDERSPALGLRGARYGRSADLLDEADPFQNSLPSVRDYVWSNLGFLAFGLFVGVALGAIGHMFYVLHGNIPRSRYNHTIGNYNFSSDH